MLKTRLALSAATIVAFAGLPAAACAAGEAVVPPSNSAATQYTETFPTSGGDKKTDQKPGRRSPSKVLGSHNAHKLQEQGPEGKAAAEAAAATAPSTITTSAQPAPSQHQGGNGKGDGGAAAPHSGAGRNSDEIADLSQHVRVEANGPTPEPSGSSGIGSAIEQATGLSTSGQSGTLLPLVIIATVLFSLAYLWRQRRQVG